MLAVYDSEKYNAFNSRNSQGRFPANLITDGSEEVAGMFPQTDISKGGQSGTIKSGITYSKDWGGTQNYKGCGFGDDGSAARFFYTAKPSKEERDRYMGDVTEKCIVSFATANGTSGKPSSISEGRNTTRKNDHVTVKPLSLMKYLVKLIAPPKNALILDPFMGSGTTLLACRQLNVKSVGIELDEHNCEIAAKRLSQGVLDFNKAAGDTPTVE
jgi:DNA modification methylase